MTEYSLDFIGRTLVDLRDQVRALDNRVGALERGVGELKDELTVNTAMLMRNTAEPIAGAALQNQISRMRDWLEAMEQRVGLVESRLPGE